MIAKTRLSPVWQVAGAAVAVLCCYLVSQWVASERAMLAKVDRQIAREQDGIAKLSTEIATRSRLTQIESWNRQLALQAPRPGQYLDSGVQLASLFARDAHPQLPLDPAAAPEQGPVQTVAYRAPAPLTPAPLPSPPSPVLVKVAPAPRKIVPGPEAVPAEPVLRAASYVRPKSSRMEDAAPATERAAFSPAGPLLSPEIASLAKAEQARGGIGGR